MANIWKRPKSLKNNSRSPGSISNAQHHDPSISERDIAGSPGTFKKIISDSATAQPVGDFAVIRLLNTTASMQFLFIGKQADAPAGAPDITNGMAIPPNFYENIYIGKLEGNESIFIKSSANGLQIIEMES